jgi:hypothetical protein
MSEQTTGSLCMQQLPLVRTEGLIGEREKTAVLECVLVGRVTSVVDRRGGPQRQAIEVLRKWIHPGIRGSLSVSYVVRPILRPTQLRQGPPPVDESGQTERSSHSKRW